MIEHWLPHAGHFIGGAVCQFRLAVVLEGSKGAIIVSTVGEMAPHSVYLPGRSAAGVNRTRRDSDPFETIGFERLYETAVFKAERAYDNTCCGWIADITREQLDFAGYNDANAAAAGHRRLMLKWREMVGE